jgi:hypothetical protein
MFKKVWSELNKPRKFWDITNLVGYAIIASMVVWLNHLSYQTGEFVGIKEMQQEAIEHHAGMWDVFHSVSEDGRWFWRDEWVKMVGRYPWEVTPEVLEKLEKERLERLEKQKH